MTNSAAAHRPSSSALKQARVDVLVPAIRKSILSSGISVAIFGALLFPYSPGGMISWVAVRLVISLLTLAAIKRLVPDNHDSDQTIRALAATMAISGVVWGAIPLFIRPDEPEWRAVVVLWLFGNQSVVTAVCSPSRTVFRAASGSVTIVGAGSVLLYGDTFGLVLSIILILGGIYSLSIFSAMHRSVNSAIEGNLTAAALASSMASQQTELQAANAKLSKLANRDELTNLLNRRSFFTSVVDETGAIRRAGWLAYLDLDRFKNINDTYGHATGDRVLQIAAERWLQALPGNAVLARTGGDEFAVWFDAGESEALEVCGQLNRQISSPMTTANGTTLTVSCSIGLTRVRSGESFLVAAGRADNVLYEVKAEGRNNLKMSDTLTDESKDGLRARTRLGTPRP